MKDLILKHKSLLGGYERIESLERMMSSALSIKLFSKKAGLTNSSMDSLIIRTRKSINRMLILTKHIENNY